MELKCNVKRNDKESTKEFKFALKDEPAKNFKSRNTVAGFLVSFIFPEDEKAGEKKLYYFSASAGYNRTRESRRFYPEKRQGSFYGALDFIYDPLVNVKEKNISIHMGDYLNSSLYFAYNSQIRENYFNIDISLWGRQKYAIQGESETRSVHGLFTSLEYFRPGFRDTTLFWNHQVRKNEPHIQYFIYKPVAFGGFLQNREKARIYTASAMFGIGPSINSALVATDIDTVKEQDLSPIFKSLDYKKENFYYSVVAAFRTVLEADFINSFKFSLGFDNYSFYALEFNKDKAYEILNIIKCGIGYHLTANALIAAHYEHWRINSFVRDEYKDHFWNRMVLELKYSM